MCLPCRTVRPHLCSTVVSDYLQRVNIFHKKKTFPFLHSPHEQPRVSSVWLFKKLICFKVISHSDSRAHSVIFMPLVFAKACAWCKRVHCDWHCFVALKIWYFPHKAIKQWCLFYIQKRHTEDTREVKQVSGFKCKNGVA